MDNYVYNDNGKNPRVYGGDGNDGGDGNRGCGGCGNRNCGCGCGHGGNCQCEPAKIKECRKPENKCERPCDCDCKKKCPELKCETKPLGGAKFELVEGRSGCVIACGVTNHKGELEFSEIPFGNYALREVDAPKGYEFDCRPVCVEIDRDHPDKCVEICNRKKQGSIRILKLGKEEFFDFKDGE